MAFIYGSVARAQARRGSDVDVMIIGEVSFAQATEALGRAQVALGREVNPSVHSPHRSYWMAERHRTM